MIVACGSCYLTVHVEKDHNVHFESLLHMLHIVIAYDI